MFGHVVDEISGSSKGMGLKIKRYRGLLEKSDASFDNMAMATLGKAVVFRSVKRGGEMGDAIGG